MATKKVKDLKKGDVIRTEFGAEGNWVTGTVQKVVAIDSAFLNCKIYCKYSNGSNLTMYGKANDDVEIIEV